MEKIDNDIICKALDEISRRIELCGASIELTNAVSLVSDLRQAVGDSYNEASEHALSRVIAEMK